jgi:pyruvate/2-oxoglutarate dehydrogenase complex dihydrolipoamide dehydrogenase (E3) component
MGAVLGAKTALIERHRLGGDCTWNGCVPSKALLRAASVAHTVETAVNYGFDPLRPTFSFPSLMQRLQSVQEQIYEKADAPPNMEKLGIQVICGTAAFSDPNTITVGGRFIRARFFVIATGSRPRHPGFEAPVLTNESVFRLSSRPERLVIVGAGPMGVEMAQAFRRLGSQVTVVGSDPEILPRDDGELAALLRTRLEAEGIQFLVDTRTMAARETDSGIVVRLSNGSTVECDAILMSTGREVDTKPLRLEVAGVRKSEDGFVIVDSHCRTSRRNIYAVGDVTGRQQFTHMAEHMAKIAITNCILRWPASIDKAVPWCTFTSPELAHTGCNTDGSDSDPASRVVLRFPMGRVDRAVVDGDLDGLVKVVTDRSGRVLGASILAPHAGELINIWSLAVRRRMKVGEIGATIHPYPTYSLGNRRAADRWSERWLDSPLLTLLGRVLGHRGTRRRSHVLD